MKTYRLLAGLVPVVLACAAQAQTVPACPASCTTGAPVPNLGTFLGGRTVCAVRGNESWQEFHQGNGTGIGPLIDWKKGPGDPVDPQTQVGGWAVSSPGRGTQTVSYIYSGAGGGTYTFSVCGPLASGKYDFCTTSASGSDVKNATLVAGQVSCAGVQAAVRAPNPQGARPR